jgi:hypothetical protein
VIYNPNYFPWRGRFMKKITLFSLITACLIAFAVVFEPDYTAASSHREAPIISTDPLADNTDVYAFVHSSDQTKLNIIACFNPLEEPAGGPNFSKFGTDVLYEIKIDNVGDRLPHIIYQFEFQDIVGNQNTFLYNTGSVTSNTDPDLNVRQTYTVRRIVNGVQQYQMAGLPVPPNYVGGTSHMDPLYMGPQSMPNYATLMSTAVQTVNGTTKVFCGPTDDPFYVDLGAAFDLLKIRPGAPGNNNNGKDALAGYNVHSIALQIPKGDLTRNGNPNPPANDSNAIVGIWSTTSRRSTTVIDSVTGIRTGTGNWVQVSRLGMPLVNEVVLPLGQKDRWNSSKPVSDVQFLNYVTTPELPIYLNLFYPVLIDIPLTNRNDLVAVFLTGVMGLNQRPQDTRTPCEEIRVNLGIPPTATENRLGVIGGDIAGFPNGRRLADDVIDIALRVVAGVLLDTSFANGPNGQLGDGVQQNDLLFSSTFPFLAPPHEGFENKHGRTYIGPIGILPPGGNVPNKMSLKQNYPNPFNPTTQIKFDISKTQNVTLKIFDILGREVRTLINEIKSPGEYSVTWDGKNGNGVQVSTGVYFYRIESGDFTDIKKMVLVK